MTFLVVEQRRGFAVEGVHDVDGVACDAEGRVVASVGDDPTTTFRSAAKPFQLETSLSGLAVDQRAALTAQDLAIGAASHHGEPDHVLQVQGLLRKLGCQAGDLLCGAHEPSHAPSAHALYATGALPSVLHNNCSGKHAFMAAAARGQGFAPDYLAQDHPLQRQIYARVDERSGRAVRGAVVDGCGLPCFVLPLSGMARAWAQLAVAMGPRATGQDGSLGRIGLAMRDHPFLISGTDAFDGWLTSTAPLLAKVGAQGLLCAALPELGVGVAIKIRSGADAVRPVAVWALLSSWFGATCPEPLPERFQVVTNAAGRAVGEIATRWVAG